MTPTLQDNLARVRARLHSACRDAGRSADQVALVAVTKSVDVERALELAALGVRDLGESRVQELERKALAFRARGASARWHLIGHLQRNKARRAVELADAIHSVDSLRLLEDLERLAAESGRRPEIFLEVRLADGADAAERTGFAPAELARAVERARALPHVVLRGLMGIAPAPLSDPPDAGDRARARAAFAALRELARALPREAFAGGRPLLSMGMSSDFEDALREGADVVRVGGALFEDLPDGSSVSGKP